MHSLLTVKFGLNIKALEEVESKGRQHIIWEALNEPIKDSENFKDGHFYLDI